MREREPRIARERRENRSDALNQPQSVCYERRFLVLYFKVNSLTESPRLAAPAFSSGEASTHRVGYPPPPVISIEARARATSFHLGFRYFSSSLEDLATLNELASSDYPPPPRILYSRV